MIALKCPICGAPLLPSKTKPRKYCSRACARKARRMGLAHMTPDEVATAFAAPSHVRRRVEIGQETAPITVDCVRTTDGRTLVVETRGRCCVGWRSAGHVSHS